MAALRTVVLSASIDNADDVRRWIETVQERCRAIQDGIDALVAELQNAQHIIITLRQDGTD